MIRLFTQLCHRDVDMAVKVFRRLKQCWVEPWELEICDDGSLVEEDREKLQEALPACRQWIKGEVRDQIREKLSHHPACLEFYSSNVLATKLLEIPLLAPETLYFCDADVLFLRPVRHLWPADPAPIFLRDEDLGYSFNLKQLLFELRVPISAFLNSGLFRYEMRDHDLDRIEWFISKTKGHRFPFLIEQSCWAFLLGNQKHHLYEKEAVLCPLGDLPRENLPAAIHFIGSRKHFFGEYYELSEREGLIRPEQEWLPYGRGRRVTSFELGLRALRRFAKR